jgi:hypothetical protein
MTERFVLITIAARHPGDFLVTLLFLLRAG